MGICATKSEVPVRQLAVENREQHRQRETALWLRKIVDDVVAEIALRHDGCDDTSEVVLGTTFL